MDIERVNGVLLRAIDGIQAGEIEAIGALHRVSEAKESVDILSQGDVKKLPVGSLVFQWANNHPNGSALVVIPGEKLTDIAILPRGREGWEEVDGDPVTEWGHEFALIMKGRGKLPTHNVAQRHAIAWSKGVGTLR
jgi:hypothetical protein